MADEVKATELLAEELKTSSTNPLTFPMGIYWYRLGLLWIHLFICIYISIYLLRRRIYRYTKFIDDTVRFILLGLSDERGGGKGWGSKGVCEWGGGGGGVEGGGKQRNGEQHR